MRHRCLAGAGGVELRGQLEPVRKRDHVAPPARERAVQAIDALTSSHQRGKSPPEGAFGGAPSGGSGPDALGDPGALP